MSPQESELLQQFLNRLSQTPLTNKDAQADALIRQTLALQADAPYLLVQRAVLLEQALSNAQNQIAQLQAENLELKAARNHPAGFLDQGNQSWGRSATGTNSPSPTPITPPPLNPIYANNNPSHGFFGQSGGFFGGNTGNVLGTVAATAAGVAAGAFLFQGIEGLLGNHNNHVTNNAGAAALNDDSGGLIPNYFEDAPSSAESLGIDDLALNDDSGLDDVL